MSARRIATAGLVGSMVGLLLVLGATPASAAPVRFAAAYRDPDKALDGSPLATVYVPAGNWVFIARATIDYGDPSQTVTCQLDAGGDFDRVATSNGDEVRSIMLLVVHPFTTDGSASIWCDAASGAVSRNVRLYGYRVSRLSNRQLPSGNTWTQGSGTPQALAGWRNGPVTLPKASNVTVGSLPLPRGRWWVMAKLSGRSTSQALLPAQVSCTLGIGSARSGWSRARVVEAVGPGELAVLPMQHIGQLTRRGAARVTCRANNASEGSFLKIVAIRAGKLSSGTLGGPTRTRGRGAPLIRGGWKAGPVLIPMRNAYREIGRIYVPGKRYWFVLATATVEHTASKAAIAGLDCRLTSDDDPDRLAGVDLSPGWPHMRAGIVLGVLHRADTALDIALRCRAGGAALRARDIRIVAISPESIQWNVFK